MPRGYADDSGIFTPAALFCPPNDDDTPEELFTIFSGDHRFYRRSNRQQILIFTDGACLNNGHRSRPAVGGCAFVFRDEPGTVSFRLENRGPSRVVSTHTSNRAELRAVIAALQYRRWNDEGVDELVIATDSEYVVNGATQWVDGWVNRGWRTVMGSPVKNQDLWAELFKEIQRYENCWWRSLRVLFWWIPREWNENADWAAKEAAATGEECESFTKKIAV